MKIKLNEAALETAFGAMPVVNKMVSEGIITAYLDALAEDKEFILKTFRQYYDDDQYDSITLRAIHAVLGVQDD